MKINSVFLGGIWLAMVSCVEEGAENRSFNTKEYVQLTDDKYNAVSLNNQVSSIQKASLRLVDSVFKSSGEAISVNLVDAIFELDISIDRLSRLGEEHEMAKYFSNAVIKLLQFYKSEFESNFQNLIPILEKKELSSADRSKLNDYDRLFVSQEADIFNEIMIRQDSFAQYFNIGLRE